MPFMPVLEYGWSLTPIYNNKRKHQEEDESMNLESEVPCKRPCQQPHISESLQMEESEINHNTVIFPNQNNQLISQLHQEEIHGCMKDVASSMNHQYIHNNTPESCAQTLSSSQNDMIMDLTDEIYSNATLENDRYLESMDNDCVPDSQQYNKQNKDPSCNNCVGERSPTKSLVRCYCKPTWEHLMDLRPYISDYY